MVRRGEEEHQAPSALGGWSAHTIIVHCLIKIMIKIYRQE